MECVTKKFSFWREVKDSSVDHDSVVRLFNKLKDGYGDYKSVPADKFCALLSDLFKELGTDCPFEEKQAQHILDTLADVSEHGAMIEDYFLTCFKYWTRKDIATVKALLITDVQNDFIRGSLSLSNCPAKEDGEEVVPCINELIESKIFDVLVYTLDWHPADHVSFLPNLKKHAIDPSIRIEEVKLYDKIVVTKPLRVEQVMWPVHCVQNTWGAELHKDLKKPDPSKDIVILKGTDLELDSYSGFWDNGHYCQTGLFKQLLERNVTDVYVAGLAYDVCVAATAKDASNLGFNVFVIRDACKVISAETACSTTALFQSKNISIVHTCSCVSCK